MLPNPARRKAWQVELPHRVRPMGFFVSLQGPRLDQHFTFGMRSGFEIHEFCHFGRMPHPEMSVSLSE